MNETFKLTPGRLILFTVGLPVLALYGCLVLLRGLAHGARRILGARLALASELACCNGHRNPTVGRWNCGSCKATYHGWVGRCAVCGSGAGWMSCRTCQISVPFPWVP